jgi:hypothetical protein
MFNGRNLRVATLVVWGMCALTAGAICPDNPTPGVKVVCIDLATMAVDQTSTRPGGPGTYRFVLVNVVPKFKPYHVDISRDFVLLEPLTFPGGTQQKAASESSFKTRNLKMVGCKATIDPISDDLLKETTETGVKLIVDKARRDNKGKTCETEVDELIADLTEQSVDAGGLFPVGSAETLTVTIARKGATWTYLLQAKPRGEWRTNYGFFFVPDRDERFFTKQTDIKADPDAKPTPIFASTKFTIEEQPDRETFDFVPTVLFTFLPYSQIGKNFAHGLSAGLGYDLEKPVVVAGYSGTYNENVVFTAGVAFHRQSRLLGRYNVGDKVTEVLDSSQLVEDTYGPNIYVGVAFRFGEDIHARRRELEKATARAQAEAATAKAKAAQLEKDALARQAACKAKADEQEAIAKEACTKDDIPNDEPCFTKAAAASAAAKEACAVTEQEKVDAEEAAKEAKDEAKETEIREQCKKAEEKTHAAAVKKCAADEQCKLDADAAYEKALLACLKGN